MIKKNQVDEKCIWSGMSDPVHGLSVLEQETEKTPSIIFHDAFTE